MNSSRNTPRSWLMQWKAVYFRWQGPVVAVALQHLSSLEGLERSPEVPLTHFIPMLKSHCVWFTAVYVAFHNRFF